MRPVHRLLALHGKDGVAVGKDNRGEPGLRSLELKPLPDAALIRAADLPCGVQSLMFKRAVDALAFV